MIKPRENYLFCRSKHRQTMLDAYARRSRNAASFAFVESGIMAIDVFKFEIKSVADASGLEKAIKSKLLDPDSVIAVIGKTEGNGGVNDFTRMLSDDAFRKVLRRHGKRSEAEISEIPMVWSGGC